MARATKKGARASDREEAAEERSSAADPEVSPAPEVWDEKTPVTPPPSVGLDRAAEGRRRRLACLPFASPELCPILGYPLDAHSSAPHAYATELEPGGPVVSRRAAAVIATGATAEELSATADALVKGVVPAVIATGASAEELGRIAAWLRER